MKTRVQFRLRLYRDDRIALGPGKVDLLEAIGQAGSISAAARQLGMSYRRAWLLVNDMNEAFGSPAVHTATGGARGGGTALTPVGQRLIELYRTIESASRAASAEHIAALTRLLAA